MKLSNIYMRKILNAIIAIMVLLAPLSSFDNSMIPSDNLMICSVVPVYGFSMNHTLGCRYLMISCVRRSSGTPRVSQSLSSRSLVRICPFTDAYIRLGVKFLNFLMHK